MKFLIDVCKSNVILVCFFIVTISLACQNEDPRSESQVFDPNDSIPLDANLPEDTIPDSIKYTNVEGCDGQFYLNPAVSPYILPFKVGKSFRTGLTNCSSSYHSSGNPDQYAFDFNMQEGTPFIAVRAGTVTYLVENQPSEGGGQGNFVVISHGDGTYALYAHSPKDGIDVKVGDRVKQGEVLGKTGRSGLAGYAHLHFIVLKGHYLYPYNGLAISFKNASPLHVALKGNTLYEAKPFE